MSDISSLSKSSWDRTFLHISSALAEPFCTVYGKLRYRVAMPLNRFGGDPVQGYEIAKRVAIVASALFSAILCFQFPTMIGIPLSLGMLTLGIGHVACRATGFALQKNGYTHVRLEASEKTMSGSLKVMSWNICGIGASFPYEFGGVIPWPERFEGIVAKIQEADPDVLVLQEEYDTLLGEALLKRLKNQYAHAYFHLGQNAAGVGSGIMVFSKCAPYRFAYENYRTCGYFNRRGFATLEIKANPIDQKPAVRIIGTHLAYKGLNQPVSDVRETQLHQIFSTLQLQKTIIPTLLAGDTNIERTSLEKDRAYLADHIAQEYLGGPTCSDSFKEQWKGLPYNPAKVRTIDHVSLLRSSGLLALPVQTEGVHLEYDEKVKAFTPSDAPALALSDHHPIVATVIWPV